MAILHGGQLSRVAKIYNLPEQNWLDLSTGIAPFSYPIPSIPNEIWQKLPTISDTLIHAAQTYYQARYCCPLAGSQYLIERLPALWQNKVGLTESKHVYLPKVGYKEHQQAWSKAGYQIHFYQQYLPEQIEKKGVVVVINPNNPLTDTFSVKQLKVLQAHCHQQQALLIIDEAFADVFSPDFSFIPHIPVKKNDLLNEEYFEDIIVLRSFGKFFGLAGVRIGFACCTSEWHYIIQQCIGPWSINGPALYVAELALQDASWHKAQRVRLEKASQALLHLLEKYFTKQRIQANALFMTVFVDDAEIIFEKLCKHSVYVRLTDENNSLRFGTPNEKQLSQLAEALSAIG